ncbi:LppU/SCO3897 family protein [Streptomyces sp. MUM 178J]|uniref:LppU/SCO3897 family protein n=1 Tax=Streptomyces sp. MUM 178J TaxID=2791991 RepID=UPI001F039CD1|nr:hypothetical protein [Streptomyces sp. MUM 178J]WRQ82516.1 hypothetical protein I3F59_025925 [Streptomyces sp. MUM 178J]
MTHPPQPGPHAYGQPGPYAQQPQQPGYGYPQQQPYPPQQPGQGFPQQPAQPQQQWGAPPPPPPPSGGRRISIKTIFRIVVAVVAVIGFGVFWLLSQNDAENAEAGDCMHNNGTTISPDLEIVECGDTKAEFKVVSVHADTTDSSVCDGKADIGYYEQTSGGRRSSGQKFVLCLNEIEK